MKPVILKANPSKCPKCGGEIVPIVYGEPLPDILEKAKNKEVVLGGCCVKNGDNPMWACCECNHRF